MPAPPSRRDALYAALATGSLAGAAAGEARKPDARRASPKLYDMKKSINLWAFPYPARMTLRECLQLAKDAGFDGIELNYDLDSDLLAEGDSEGPASHPQDGCRGRHRRQRVVLVPVLAVRADEQQARGAGPRGGAG